MDPSVRKEKIIEAKYVKILYDYQSVIKDTARDKKNHPIPGPCVDHYRAKL